MKQAGHKLALCAAPWWEGSGLIERSLVSKNCSDLSINGLKRREYYSLVAFQRPPSQGLDCSSLAGGESSKLLGVFFKLIRLSKLTEDKKSQVRLGNQTQSDASTSEFD